MKKYNITVKGTTYEVLVEEVPLTGQESNRPASPMPPIVERQNADVTRVTAPMPGTVLRVEVRVGQTVRRGTPLCTLEAMKMENAIAAPVDGVVEAVPVVKGSMVGAGDLLVTIR